jgi:hypothetical protein
MEQNASSQETATEDNDGGSPFHDEDGMVEFSVDSIHEQLVCHLCGGFYRDPFTTTKCHHTFCRSCLGVALDAQCSNCPKCDTYLGKDMSKFASPDHVLQVLIDKVLFPDIAAEDSAMERDFYRKRGIEPKLDAVDNTVQEQSTPAAAKRKKKHRKTSKEVTLELLPEESSSNDVVMPALEFPLLRTESSIRVGQIKKYLLLKLPDLEGKGTVEVLCHGTPLGDELSVGFVLRTVWMEHNEHLRLTYRFAVGEKQN